MVKKVPKLRGEGFFVMMWCLSELLLIWHVECPITNSILTLCSFFHLQFFPWTKHDALLETFFIHFYGNSWCYAAFYTEQFSYINIRNTANLIGIIPNGNHKKQVFWGKHTVDGQKVPYVHRRLICQKVSVSRNLSQKAIPSDEDFSCLYPTFSSKGITFR